MAPHILQLRYHFNADKFLQFFSLPEVSQNPPIISTRLLTASDRGKRALQLLTAVVSCGPAFSFGSDRSKGAYHNVTN